MEVFTGKRKVYLVKTSNILLAERLDNGEVIEGVLEADERTSEALFRLASGTGIAFLFNHITVIDNSEEEGGKSVMLSNGDMYYRFNYSKSKEVISS